MSDQKKQDLPVSVVGEEYESKEFLSEEDLIKLNDDLSVEVGEGILHSIYPELNDR